MSLIKAIKLAIKESNDNVIRFTVLLYKKTKKYKKD